MNANFGLLPKVEKKIRNKKEKNEMLANRALDSLAEYANRTGLAYIEPEAIDNQE
ncbi:Methylenetetrahydrofolate--tRNA-(uracil-5-)-methyltransferase TrmFO [compost metagenome]